MYENCSLLFERAVQELPRTRSWSNLELRDLVRPCAILHNDSRLNQTGRQLLALGLNNSSSTFVKDQYSSAFWGDHMAKVFNGRGVEFAFLGRAV